MLCLLQSEQSLLSVEGQEITMLRLRKPALYVFVSMCCNMPNYLVCKLYIWLLYLERHNTSIKALSTCVLIFD